MKYFELKNHIKELSKNDNIDNIEIIIIDNLIIKDDDEVIINSTLPNIKSIRIKINFIDGGEYFVKIDTINKLLRAKNIKFQFDFNIKEYTKNDFKKELKVFLNDYIKKENLKISKFLLEDLLKKIVKTYFSDQYDYEKFVNFSGFWNEVKKIGYDEKHIIFNSLQNILTKYDLRELTLNKIYVINKISKSIDKTRLINIIDLYDKLHRFNYIEIESINYDDKIQISKDILNFYRSNFDFINYDNIEDNEKIKTTIDNIEVTFNTLEDNNEVKNVEIIPAPAPVVNEIKEVKLLLPAPAKIENKEVIEQKESIKLLPAPEQNNEFIQASKIIDYSKILEKFEKLTKNKICDYCEEQAKFVTYWEGRTKVYLCEKCTIEIYEINKDEIFT